MFGMIKKIEKVKISNSIYHELKNEAVRGEQNNIVVCGVLLGDIGYINVGLKMIYQAKCSQIINYETLQSNKALISPLKVREGLFFGNSYDIYLPDPKIINKQKNAIGIYAFFPRNLKKLEENIKKRYRNKGGSFKFMLLTSFKDANIISKKEKSVKGISGFLKTNEINELQILKSRIHSMQMNIVCLQKNMNPVSVEIVV